MHLSPRRRPGPRHSKRSYLDASSDKVENAINESQRMNGIPRNIQIDGVAVEEGAVERVTFSEKSAGDGIGAAKDDELGSGGCIVANLQGFSHVFRDGAGNHQTISVPWGSNEFNTVASHIKADIPGGIEFHFIAGIAGSRNLAEFEGTAEESADFFAYQIGIENDRNILIGPDNQVTAIICGDMVVVGEPDLIRSGKFAFPAKNAFSQINGKRIRLNSAGWAKIGQFRGLFCRELSGNHRPAAEKRRQFGSPQIWDVLNAMLPEYFDGSEHELVL